MKQVEWKVTPKAVAALVRGWGGMPADGDDFDPRGPIGPIAFALQWRLADRVNPLALNPQPIPPVDEMARLLAQSFVAEMAQLRSLADALPKESAGSVQARMASRTSEFLEYCGTGALLQLLAELRRKWGRPIGGGDPPPRPNELDNALARLAIGAELYAAGGLAEGMAQAGEKLMSQGLKQLG